MHLPAQISRIGAAAVIGAATLGGGALALAATTSHSATTFTACVSSHRLIHLYRGTRSCPRHQAAYTWNKAGQRGPRGYRGRTGRTGPSGLSLTSNTSMQTSAIPTQLKQIGGLVRGNQTNVLQVFLKQGSYLVNANIKFDRSVSMAASGAGSSPVRGYLILWTGVGASTGYTSFAQGAGTFTTGALSPTVGANGDVIDSTAGGSHILMVPKGGEYLNLSAFAYDENTSGGPYKGCVGIAGTNPAGTTACLNSDGSLAGTPPYLTVPGSVVVTSADLSVLKVG